MKRIAIVFSALVLLSCAACGGGGGSSGSDTLVMGVVTDMNGLPVAGVTVTAVGTDATAATTDSDGYFSITDLSESEHQVVSFAKSGYASTSAISRIISGQGDFLSVTMSPVGTTSTYAASSAKTLTTSGAQLAIPASSFVDSSGQAYTGNVTVSLTSFDPTSTDASGGYTGLNAFPGEFVGVDSNLANPAGLVSYGYATMSAVDANGDTVSLKSNPNVTLTVPIPTSMQAGAGATIELWRYDDTTGEWVKSSNAGTMTGTSYQATLTSFSTWNYDVSYQAGYVTGTVVDCATNEPIVGARVYIVGTGWKSGETGTKSDGSFPNSGIYGWLGVPVNPNATFTYWAEKNGVRSATATGTGPSAGLTSALPTICIYTIAGSYSGSYAGSTTSGSWSATVSESGLITGSGSDVNEGGFDITGHVLANGVISMGAVSIYNTSFSGLIDGRTGAATGTWASSVDAGTFSGAKN